jgi:hypothetical protein
MITEHQIRMAQATPYEDTQPEERVSGAWVLFGWPIISALLCAGGYWLWSVLY